MRAIAKNKGCTNYVIINDALNDKAVFDCSCLKKSRMSPYAME